MPEPTYTRLLRLTGAFQQAQGLDVVVPSDKAVNRAEVLEAQRAAHRPEESADDHRPFECPTCAALEIERAGLTNLLTSEGVDLGGELP